MYESHENACQYLVPINKQDTIVCVWTFMFSICYCFGELMVDIFTKDCQDLSQGQLCLCLLVPHPRLLLGHLKNPGVPFANTFVIDTV